MAVPVGDVGRPRAATPEVPVGPPLDDAASAPGAAAGEADLDDRLEGFYRFGRRLADVRIATWVVLALIALYTAYFATRTLAIHRGLGTASYDSALYDQGMWLMSRFDAPFVTLMGRNLMGDHTSFVLVFLVPLYWIAPGAWIMFTAQAAAIGAGALPVYLYARRRLRSDVMGVAMALAYLLHPAVSWTNMENFHPDAFLGVFVGFAIYAALERRWRLYAAFVVLSLLVKEDVSLVIVPLGVWVAIKRDRRIGLLTIFGSLAFMAVAMFAVMRSLIGVPTRNGWRIPFGGPRGLVETSIRNPTQLIDHLRRDGRPWYLWQMLSPLGLMLFRRPSVAAISAVVLSTNVVSTFWYQFQIEYHYSLIAVPALVMGTTYALGALPRFGGVTRAKGLAVVVACSLFAAYTWAPLPFAKSNPRFWPSDHPVAEAMRDIIDDVPDGASVAAHYRVTPHLAHRREIYQFPNPFRVVLYGVDVSLENSRLDERADGVEYLVLQLDKSPENAADFEVIRSAFTLVRANVSWELWRRDPSIPLPPSITAP